MLFLHQAHPVVTLSPPLTASNDMLAIKEAINSQPFRTPPPPKRKMAFDNIESAYPFLNIPGKALPLQTHDDPIHFDDPPTVDLNQVYN